MEEVLGLPAHPLLVHAPVVLVPLGAATALAALVLRRFRTTLLVVAAGLALVGGVTAYLAAGAGEPLEDRLERTGALTEAEEERLDDHESAGDRAKWASIAFAVVAVTAAGTAVAVTRRGVGTGGVVTGMAVASLLVGAAATTAVALAGHSGARAVWEDDSGPAPADGNDGRDDDTDGDRDGRRDEDGSRSGSNSGSNRGSDGG